MQHKAIHAVFWFCRNMNKWKAIPLLQHSVEFLQMHSCGQRRNGKYVADVKYGVWMAARCCIEAGTGRDGVQEILRRRLDMSGRFNVAPMATRPLPSQYNTDSMHRSHPLWASAELWVKFRKQCVCRLWVLEWTIFYNSAQWSWSWSAQCLPTLPFREQFCLDSVKTSWAAALPLKWPIPQSINSDQHDNTKPRNFCITEICCKLYVFTRVLLLMTFFMKSLTCYLGQGKCKKRSMWWIQLLFCIWDNWQERQKDTQQRRATTLDANDLLFGNSAVLLCQHWGSVVRSTPHQNLLFRVKPAAAPNSQLHWECPSGAATLLSNFDSANTFFVVVLAIGNGSQGKWKSFRESEMYVLQLANILGEKSLIKHKVASLNMPMRWRVHVVQKTMKSIW